PNENASAVSSDPGGESPTESAELGLAEQAAGSGDPVLGTSSEPHQERAGEAGLAGGVEPGAPGGGGGEEGGGGAGRPRRGRARRAKASEVNADEQGQPKAVLETESSAVKEILDKAVAEATGTTGDRLARLRDALQAVGRQADRVRLVRVFGSEEEVQGAKKI